MKLLFIYLAVVLAISLYMWVNILKEGNQDIDMSALNERLASTYTVISGQNRAGSQATTEKDTSPDILKTNTVTPGITTIDRYADPMCNTNEYIYCVDGQIECQDIFGDVINSNLQTVAPYTSGNTYKNTCDSYIDKVNLNEYIKNDIDISGTGVYFDLSNCPPDNPWRSGGVFEKVGQINSITPESYSCHEAQSVAENVMNEWINKSLNEDVVYKKNDDVYILSSYLIYQDVLGLPQALAILNQNKTLYTTINNQKYYYGTITEVTGDTYTVNINNGNVSVKNIPKNALLKNSLYNKKSNDYYSDLKTGSHKRPVCKSGRFTSCLSSPPFTIENGIYKSVDDATLDFYTDGSDPNMTRKTQSLNDLTYTPFSAPPVNPSGIIDNPSSSLLEYNYFASQPETPFIKCIADYSSNIGDPLCCNQTGQVKDTKYICPEEVPTCRGYSVTDTATIYGYCN
jgi:hypothetical protein